MKTDLIKEIIKQGGLFGISVLLVIFCYILTTDHIDRSTDAFIGITKAMTILTSVVEENIELNKRTNDILMLK